MNYHDKLIDNLRDRAARGEELSPFEKLRLGNARSDAGLPEDPQTRAGLLRALAARPEHDTAASSQAALEEARLRAANPATLRPIDRLKLFEFERIAAEKAAKEPAPPEPVQAAPTAAKNGWPSAARHLLADEVRQLANDEKRIAAQLAAATAQDSRGMIRNLSKDLDDIRQRISNAVEAGGL